MNFFHFSLVRSCAVAALFGTLSLTGCGGGGTDSASNGCNDGPTVFFTAAQVPTLTVSQVKDLRDEDLAAMGNNINLLSDAALTNIESTIAQLNFSCKFRRAQIEAFTPEQILALSPRQVRLLGSVEGGVSQIGNLKLETFARLVTDSVQVAAITPTEYATLHSPYFTSVGSNFHHLSDAVLASMQETFKATSFNFTSNLAAITPAQIETLTPTRLRLLGTAGGNAPKLHFLEEATFRQAMLRQENVERLTPTDAANLRDMHTANLGNNIKYLSDDAMRSLKGTFVYTLETKTSAVGGITATQIVQLTPKQVLLLASVNEGKGLGSMADLTFGALTPEQTATFLPEHVTSVRASQLSKLSVDAIAAMTLNTRASFTSMQTRELNAVQAALFE